MSGKGKAWSVSKGQPLVCHYCGIRLRRDVNDTRDHVIPRSLGGPNTQWNRVPACADCNYAKNAKTYEEFTGKPELPPENHFRTTESFLAQLKRKPPSERLSLP